MKASGVGILEEARKPKRGKGATGIQGKSSVVWLPPIVDDLVRKCAGKKWEANSKWPLARLVSGEVGCTRITSFDNGRRKCR